MMLDPNSNRFTYAYDPAGRLAGLVNPEGDRTTFSYDAASERTRQLQANGVSTSREKGREKVSGTFSGHRSVKWVG